MARHPEAQRRHEHAMQRGEPGYLDPETGLFVMTRQYLLDRGYCCRSGCRHCPYGFERSRQGDA